MEHFQEDDLVRIKELLRHASEFIAYFELAETKMLEWRHEIELQASRLQQHAQKLEDELVSLKDLLSQTGAAAFRMAAEKALTQGEAHVHHLEQRGHHLSQHLHQQQEKLNDLTEKSLAKIEHHSTQAVHHIVTQLAKYDANQFQRIASESCDHVARAANDAVNKSNKLLSMLHWRFGLFAVITTSLTAFIFALYLNGELPWEMHHKAKNERQAGKVLLQAWPNLTEEERTKILHHS